MPQPQSFSDLGVAVEITDALAERGITYPFAIQEYAVPFALQGKDIIGQARTGMGKTFAFGIPLLDRVFDDATVTPPNGQVRALVVAPTRELCLQITEDLQAASTYIGLRLLAVVGGVAMDPQIKEITRGVDVIIGTPGRLLDLMRQEILDLSQVEIAVLDEADEMLDQGFIDDVSYILEATAPQRQTMLFSATMPGPIVRLTRTFMHKPILIHADPTTDEATHKTIKQIAFQSHKLDRLSAVARILQSPQRDRVIVFTRTKRTAAYLAKDLTALGFQVAPVHGGMKQQERNKALHDFRTGAISILIATDVAARGIDIAGVSHVINYQVPEDERTYVHRIGRTGRAGSSGVAITLVGWDEVDRWNSISDLLKLDLADPPQWFSSSTEFLNTFHLPHDINDHVGDPANASLSHGRE